MNWEIGIDEAGRGPCIGPMVYVCVAVSDANAQILNNPLIRDSKKLSDSQRIVSYDTIKKSSEALFWQTIEISAETITKEMECGISLNTIAGNAVIELVLSSLRHIYKKDRSPANIAVRLDTLSSDTEVYAGYYRESRVLQDVITNHFPKTKYSVNAYVKGDSLYKVISAASIMAKEVREKRIAELQKQYGDFGSGYPSDKKTITWIERNYPSPADLICRRTWKTWKNIEEKMRVRTG